MVTRSCAEFANNPGTCNPVGTVIDRSVLSNTEARDAGRQNGVAVRSVDVQYSVIHDVSTAQLFGRVHSSLLYNVSYPGNNRSLDGNYHTNVTYLQGWNGDAQSAKEPAYIHDNVIYNFGAGSGGLYANVCGNQSNATYMWNNIIYNNYSGGNSDIQIEPYGGSSGCGVFYIWNNTLQIPSGTGASAIRVVSRGYSVGTVDTRNNHFIVDGGNYFSAPSGVGTRVDGNNVVQTNSVASSQGFSISSGYPLAPNTGTAATVDRGANLSSLCSGALAGLCADTTAAVKLDPVGNKVVVNRVTLQRPATGAWDVGAFEFDANGGGSTPLNPPTNLRIAN